MFFSYILRLVCNFSVIFFTASSNNKRELLANNQNLERVRSNLVTIEVVHEYDNQLCNALENLKEVVGLSGEVYAIVLL